MSFRRFLNSRLWPVARSSGEFKEGQLMRSIEETKLLLGQILSRDVKTKSAITNLSQVEFKVFSQFGDDGIIQYLIHKLQIENKFFVEFGVEDYRESNTRFLLQNDNWQGLVMDCSAGNVNEIRNQWYFWRHSLLARCEFVTKDNINDLLGQAEVVEDTGLMHIDIDGNDYWVWEAITDIHPVIVIMEYNSLFGANRSITTPYYEAFDRFQYHHSGLLFGASLAALIDQATRKGYAFIGCNSAGNNAYFVRLDQVADLPVKSLSEGYVESSFRQHRDELGELTYLSNAEAISAMRGVLVYNVETNETEIF
jgi:hypothetical protein